MYYLVKSGKKIIEGLLNIAYPKVCPFCNDILIGEEEICKDCRKQLRYINGPRCKKCSKQLENAEKEYCYDCSKYKHNFEYGYAVWQIDEKLKKSIYRFKFDNQRYFAKVYANEIIRIYGEEIKKINPDAIIPVPLHKSRERIRGFNQSFEIAKIIGSELGIEVLDKLIIRNKKTLSQKQLNHKQRINNMKNAFIMEKNVVKLNKIIIVDDVYTTGFTIDSVAGCFLDSYKKNTVEVYFLTVGIGQGL